MKLHLLCCYFLCSCKLAVAPNCAEYNPWNSEDVTSFYERFQSSEFSEKLRDQIRDLLGEFRYVATAMEESCLCDSTPCTRTECRKSVLRGGVLLRHIERERVAESLLQIDSLFHFDQVLDQIDTLRKHIACTDFPESQTMINILHNTHYEIQRPARRKMLIKLAESWCQMPRMFDSD